MGDFDDMSEPGKLAGYEEAAPVSEKAWAALQEQMKGTPLVIVDPFVVVGGPIGPIEWSEQHTPESFEPVRGASLAMNAAGEIPGVRSYQTAYRQDAVRITAVISRLKADIESWFKEIAPQETDPVGLTWFGFDAPALQEPHHCSPWAHFSAREVGATPEEAADKAEKAFISALCCGHERRALIARWRLYPTIECYAEAASEKLKWGCSFRLAWTSEAPPQIATLSPDEVETASGLLMLPPVTALADIMRKLQMSQGLLLEIAKDLAKLPKD